MTLVVGLKCRGGLVVGTDSAITSVAGRTHTAALLGEKLELVQNTVLTASTGDYAQFQRFKELLEVAVAKRWIERETPQKVARELVKSLLQDLKDTSAARNLGALCAYGMNNKAHGFLLQHEDFQPLFLDDKLWWCAAGSGQPIADPFFGYLRDTFCVSGTMPDLQTGKFMAAWILQYVIEYNPGGVKGPFKLGVVEESEGSVAARLLDEAELAEHADMIKGAQKHLADYKSILLGESEGESVPEP